MPAVRKNLARTKRGDTIIEVMFAFAIFSMVAIMTVAMMNSGLSASERTLELVTARNELNTQAEALRFIHSSYISELKLPEYNSLSASQIASGEKYQQYKNIWEEIQGSALTLTQYNDVKIEYPLMNCHEAYADNNKALNNNHAFVVNTRKLVSTQKSDPQWSKNDIIIHSSTKVNNQFIFQEPTLNARIIYSASTGNDSGDNSDEHMSALYEYTKVARVEGIWVIAVEGPSTNGSKPQYYDFYIETCWNGTNTSVPTSLDTVIRLYNPDGA